MYFGIKHIIDLLGCYGSAVTMTTRELYNRSLKRKYLSLYSAHMFFVTIHMTDLPGCYGSTVTRESNITDLT